LKIKKILFFIEGYSNWAPLKFLLRIFALGLLTLSSPALQAQSRAEQVDYRAVFGDDYDYALKILEDHQWWADTLERDSLDPEFTLSIIFPELIRYSSISDYIEIKALEVLYVQYGKDYSDFSIGLFQMKPSFAEKIEYDIMQYDLDDKFLQLSSLEPDPSDSIQTRKARIFRLKDENFQLLYLEAFILIMDHLYPDLANWVLEDKLIFYSTAYNAGYWKGDQVIRESGGQGYFYVGMIEPEAKYVYASISLFFYRSLGL
jgi:hypothetical protein